MEHRVMSAVLVLVALALALEDIKTLILIPVLMLDLVQGYQNIRVQDYNVRIVLLLTVETGGKKQ